MVTRVSFDRSLSNVENFRQTLHYPPDSLESRITARAKRTLSTTSEEESFSLKNPVTDAHGPLATTDSHMPLTHTDLINIILALYKSKNARGICNGLAVAAIESALAGKIRFFTMQLEKLEILVNNHKANILGVAKEIKTANILRVVKEIKDDTHLLTFFDKIELCQNLSNYSSLFEPDLKPTNQCDPKSLAATLSMIASNTVRRIGGITNTPSLFSGVYSEQELVIYLQQFREVCQKSSPNDPIAIKIGSINHSISIIYYPEKNSWLFIDANQLPIKEVQIDKDLANYIQRAFQSKVVIISSEFYSLKKNFDFFNKELTSWFDSKEFKQIHQVTAEKTQLLNFYQSSWLALSSKIGQLNTVKALLGARANPNTFDNTGTTPIGIVSQEGHVDIVNTLLAAKANPNITNNFGFTPLHIASNAGYIDVINVLLAAKANPNAVTLRKITSLHIASDQGRLDIVKALLAAKANPNITNIENYTALRIASQRGHLDIAKALLAAKADPNIPNNKGTTPLHTASQHGHLDIVKALLAAKADPNIPNNKGRLPLLAASAFGHIDVVNTLLAVKVNPDAATLEGNTSLHMAAQRGLLDIVKALLAAKADPNILNNKGRSPLFAALAFGHIDVVNTLLTVKVNPDAATFEGNTPLHMAAQRGLLDIVKALLTAGANPSIINKSKDTPLLLASYEGHLAVVDTLFAAIRSSRDTIIF